SLVRGTQPPSSLPASVLPASVLPASVPPSHSAGNTSCCCHCPPVHTTRLQKLHGSVHAPQCAPSVEHAVPTSVDGSPGHEKPLSASGPASIRSMPLSWSFAIVASSTHPTSANEKKRRER